MTKILLSVFVLLLASSALACKPVPPPKCDKYNFMVNQDRYLDLLKLVKSYQGILTKTIKRPAQVSSCFNNSFAVHYGNEFKESLKEHKGRTCKSQVEHLRAQINHLIDKKSHENQAVTDNSDQKHLRREAKKIKIAMICLP